MESIVKAYQQAFALKSFSVFFVEKMLIWVYWHSCQTSYINMKFSLSLCTVFPLIFTVLCLFENHTWVIWHFIHFLLVLLLNNKTILPPWQSLVVYPPSACPLLAKAPIPHSLRQVQFLTLFIFYPWLSNNLPYTLQERSLFLFVPPTGQSATADGRGLPVC